MKTFQIITTIVGITMSLGYYPQAYKIWKLKSAKEISLINYIILGIGTLTWFIYGLVLHDIVIMISFIFGVVGSWSMIFLVMKYRNSGSVTVH
jgi:MtN3 and saliva related transmembrane protein